MRLYNFATEVTKLGGNEPARTWPSFALTIRISKKFIAAKTNPLELNTFNISVAVTDEFMEKVKKGER